MPGGLTFLAKVHASAKVNTAKDKNKDSICPSNYWHNKCLLVVCSPLPLNDNGNEVFGHTSQRQRGKQAMDD